MQNDKRTPPDPGDTAARIQALEARLRAVEHSMAVLQAALVPPDLPVQTAAASSFPPLASPTAAVVEGHAAVKPYAWPSAAQQPALTQATPKAAEIPADLGYWLGYAGLVCLIFAAVFFVKLTIDNSWLTPEAQVGGAALLGALLIGLGLRFARLDRNYWSMAPAAGIVMLYLTALAAHNYMHIAVASTSLGLTFGISLVALALHQHIGNPLYAWIAVLGSFGAPFAVAASVDGGFVALYWAGIATTFAAMRMVLNLPRLGAYVAAASMGSAYCGASLCRLLLVNDAALLLLWNAACLMLPQGFELLQARRVGRSPVALAAPRDKLTTLAWLLFYAGQYQCFGAQHPVVFALACASAAAGLLASALRCARDPQGHEGDSHQQAQLWAASGMLLHGVYLCGLTPELRSFCVPLILLLALWVGRFGATVNLWLGPACVGGTICVYELVKSISCAVDRCPSPHLIALVCAIGVAWAGVLYDMHDALTRRFVLLGTAHTLCVVGLLHLTFGYNALAVSMAWLGYALMVLLLAFVRRDTLLVRSILPVLTLACAKAFIYDVSQALPVVRIGCLLATGTSLWGAGLLWRQLARWEAAGQQCPKRSGDV